MKETLLKQIIIIKQITIDIFLHCNIYKDNVFFLIDLMFILFNRD
jgi:hypothetical protein